MSDDTQRRLEEAVSAASRVRDEANQKKNECLNQVADGLPGKLDALAKGVAQAEPEVTKTLGKAGIQQLRTELANEGAVLAADIRGAVDRVKWPMPHSDFDKVEPRKIHSALFEYMYGLRVDKLAAVFKRHGFSIHEDNSRRTQGLVLPQSLYDEDAFGPVAQALNALGEAERAVSKAKAEDDRSTVDDIWGE